MNERLAITFTGRSFARARFAGRFADPAGRARQGDGGGAGDQATGGGDRRGPGVALPDRELGLRLDPCGERPGGHRLGLGDVAVELRHLDRLGLQELLSHPALL